MRTIEVGRRIIMVGRHVRHIGRKTRCGAKRRAGQSVFDRGRQRFQLLRIDYGQHDAEIAIRILLIEVDYIVVICNGDLLWISCEQAILQLVRIIGAGSVNGNGRTNELICDVAQIISYLQTLHQAGIKKDKAQMDTALLNRRCQIRNIRLRTQTSGSINIHPSVAGRPYVYAETPWLIIFVR